MLEMDIARMDSLILDLLSVHEPEGGAHTDRAMELGVPVVGSGQSHRHRWSPTGGRVIPGGALARFRCSEASCEETAWEERSTQYGVLDGGLGRHPTYGRR